MIRYQPRGLPRRARDLIATGKHAEHSQRLTIRAEFRACISERHLYTFIAIGTGFLDRPNHDYRPMLNER